MLVLVSLLEFVHIDKLCIAKLEDETWRPLHSLTLHFELDVLVLGFRSILDVTLIDCPVLYLSLVLL